MHCFSVYFRDTNEAAWRKIGGAFVMGSAICVMHYTGMAATFTASEVSPDLSRSVSISSLGIAGIITVTLLVLVFTMLSSHAQALQVALAQAKMEFALVAGSANLAEPAHLLPRRGFDPTSVQFKRLVAPHVFVWKLSRGG